MIKLFTRFTFFFILSFLSFKATANDSDIVNCNHAWKVVVLGSSTAYGTGATAYDSSWAGKFTAYLKRKSSQNEVYNLGIPGYTSYQNLCPTGFTPPAGRPSPNSSFNITAALQLHPDAIIINMPSNDAANDYTIAEQQANFERAIHLADSANIPVWVTTTQPRNNMSAAQISSLTAMRDWIQTRFANKAVDFWSGVANADGSIATYYDYDYVHVNNFGHDLFYKRMKAETILDSLCIRATQVLVARAGNDIAVTLPVSSAVLDGSASFSSHGGIITNYQWTKLSGPVNEQIVSASSAVTNVSNLSEGRYSFLLTVTDNAFNVSSDTVNVLVSSRILIDFGPDITASPDAFGHYWNTITETQPGTKLLNAITSGNLATGIGLQVINRIDGVFNVTGPGTNTGNSTGMVSDYPATVTSDYSFAEPSATNGQWKITGLETGKQYTIKFWGTRSVGDDRIIQIKRADQATWQEYNAAGNTNYGNAAVFTFSGKAEMSFDIKVKTGSAFGYISLIDISRTTTAVSINVPPYARANNITVPLPATTGTLDGSGSGDDDGTISNYQWIQTSGPSTSAIVSPNSAITIVNNLQEGIYTFRLTVTDDSSAIAYTDVTVTVNSRILIDFGSEFTAAPDAAGKYWNNVADGLTGVKIQNAINSGNNPTGLSFEIINRIDGTFNTGGPGTNTGNTIGAVGDYPASSTTDFAFAHNSATDGRWKIGGLDSTKQYTVKFWGTRNAADERVIQIKPADESVWQEYEAKNNTDYNNAAVFTFSGKKERLFDIRVKDISTFGHISLIDIKVTNAPVNCTPSVIVTSDQLAASCAGTSITFTALATNGGSLPAYQWKKNGVIISAATSPTYTSSDLNNDDSISCVITANTNCGSGITAVSNAVAASVLPAVVIGNISGPTDPCPFTGTVNNAVYSINPVNGVNNYTWNVPPGAGIVSGQGTTSITVSYSGSFGSTGIITVTGGSCSDAIPGSLTLTKNVPAVPGAISGPVSACPYLGTATQVTYSIAPVLYATSYAWSLPANINLISGQGTNSITVTFSSGYTTSSVNVTAVSNCFSSSAASLTISTAVIASPGIISGPVDACPYIGSANTATYTIGKSAGATSYSWTVPAGASIISHPGGSGVNDTIITVSYTSNFVPGSAISVQAAGCILSAPSTLTIQKILPSAPGSISGPSEVCPYIGSANTAVYSIRKVAGVLSYLWAVPAGATIASHPGGSGINDTIITVSFNVNFISGSAISVQSGGCTPSAAASLTLLKTAPAAAGPISGPTEACSYIGTSNTAIFTTRKVTGATSYIWTVPAGVTVSSHPGGAGVNDTTIQVTFSVAFVSGTSVSVQPSSCLSGTASSLSIFKTAPPAAGSISGPTEACSYIGTSTTASYTTRKVTGATSYIWTVPAGVTVSSHPGGTGVNDTTVQVTFSAAFVSGTSISVQPASCLTGTASSLSIFKTAPPTPGAISGPTEACVYIGTTNTATYTIRKVTGATSYSWIVPAGVTVSSHPAGTGVNDTTIKVLFTSSFAGGSSISVQAVSCLSSAASNLAIQKSAPSTPGVISGPTEACVYIGTTNTATYTIRKVNGATSYNWIVPAGVTVSSHPAGTGVNDTTIKVTFAGSFVAGTSISVQAVSCTASAASSLAIQKTAPAVPGAISGPTEACAYIGTANTAIYTINKVTGATSYTWTVPVGATISSHPAGSGVNDTAINVTFTGSLVSGSNISVQAVSCATSAARTLSIVRNLPAAPGAITILVSPCLYPNYVPVGGFSIVKVPGVTYTWTVPAGSTIYHGSTTGTGDSIAVIFPLSFVNGTISVQASNGCGSNSTLSSVTVKVVLPATLSLNLTGPSDPCPYTGTATGATYKVNKVAGIASYTWTVPSTGATVVHPNPAGENDTIIIVNYTTAFTSGSISVTANTFCGSSPVKIINLVRNLPATPGTITAISLASCPNRRYSYSIPSIPANANSVNWTVPAGASILTGQGTTLITVSYPAAGATGNVTAYGVNNCGNSSVAKTLAVTLTKCATGSRSGNTDTQQTPEIKEILPMTLELTVMPNPSYTDFKLVLKTNDQLLPALLRITDISGKIMETTQLLIKGQVITVGSNYKQGIYLAELIQGDKRAVVKLVKL